LSICTEVIPVRYKKTYLSLAAAWALATAGCGGNGLVTVTGKVTLDGQPLSDATVIFVPVEGANKTTTPGGRTDESGVFYLMTREPNDGAMPGEYNVTITKKELPAKPLLNSNDIKDRESANLFLKQMKDKTAGGTIKFITPVAYADQNKTPFRSVKIPPSEPLQFDLRSDFKYTR